MYSLDQELAFATEKLKRQRAYIQELEDAVTPEIKTLKARISELEAQVSAWQRWYDHWEFSNDYNLPDSPETEDQMK